MKQLKFWRKNYSVQRIEYMLKFLEIFLTNRINYLKKEVEFGVVITMNLFPVKDDKVDQINFCSVNQIPVAGNNSYLLKNVDLDNSVKYYHKISND